MADQIGVIKFENTKSNPNITVMGVDPNYLDVSGYTLASGRNLTQHDLEEGLHVCLLGKELVDKLFKKTQSHRQNCECLVRPKTEWWKHSAKKDPVWDLEVTKFV